MVEIVKYDDLPAEVQAEADQAVADFLKRNMCANLEEAGNDVGLSPQELWYRIMGDAGLPQCEMPLSLQVR